MNNLRVAYNSLLGITRRVPTPMTENEIIPIVENPDAVATILDEEAHIVADEDVRLACRDNLVFSL